MTHAFQFICWWQKDWWSSWTTRSTTIYGRGGAPELEEPVQAAGYWDGWYQYANMRVEDYIHTETMFQIIQKIIDRVQDGAGQENIWLLCIFYFLLITWCLRSPDAVMGWLCFDLCYRWFIYPEYSRLIFQRRRFFVSIIVTINAKWKILRMGRLTPVPLAISCNPSFLSHCSLSQIISASADLEIGGCMLSY